MTQHLSGSSTENETKSDEVLHTNKGSFSQKPLVFRITYSQGNGPSLLRRTLLEAGMSEYNPQRHKESQWNLWWKGFRFKDGELALLTTSQRINHHPVPIGRQMDITRKDGLLRAIRYMRITYPKCSSLLLFPLTFNLPREEARFVSAFCQRARSTRNDLCIPQQCGTEEDECSRCLTEVCTDFVHPLPKEASLARNIWILKPADSSRGRGVFVFNHLEDLVYISKSIVQKYISDVLLIEGYKFDLRLYVVVPSYSPFIVYIYKEGLVRFATAPYNLSDLRNVYSHLTNSSINVSGPGYLVDKSGIGLGCKWTIRRFRQWMAEKNIDDRFLWIRIQAMIILTLLSQASDTPKVPNAYELFGFDILVDSRLRPWLLEVNANPSLSNECLVDEVVKRPLINSVLEMLRLNQSAINNGDDWDPYARSLPSCMTYDKSVQNGLNGLEEMWSSSICSEKLEKCSVRNPSSNSPNQDQCPLYGPGSENLLLELTALSRRFSALLEPDVSLDELRRIQKLSSPNSISQSKVNKASRSQYSLTGCPSTECRLNQKERGCGREIIPHVFGRLKLAFPFNLITRIACAKERGGYPDTRLIVQQVGQLVQHYSKWTKESTCISDRSVIDIPEVWDD